MKASLTYFFGAGTEPEFAIFTFAHFAPILLMLGLILLIAKKKDWLRSFRHEEALRWIMAFVLIVSDMS